MTEARTYPHGVTSWIDVATTDVDAAIAFYGGLLGWTFEEAVPPGVPGRYVIARLDGRDAAAIAPLGDGETPAWRTYVAVDDCNATTKRLVGLGASLVDPPADAGPGGRTSTLRDPEGAYLRLWQARARLGAQVSNEPGAWNFSNLKSRDVAAAGAWYAEAFGWRIVDQGWSTSIQVPGYGDHLEATVDPDIRTRQAQAPDGFEDVIGGILAAEGDDPHWHVVVTVADRDEAAAEVERLGGTVHDTHETDWARAAEVGDPQGARLTLSQFAPKDWD
ncbi:VOC family protein [Nocardioides sp.]|uniref:VOC family protein n=1 Tax=Nocardioides sp. TaxID=35761 RepID=UPI00271FB4F0|nr:VOC family protein [Nocardioides sp.]MDO9455450.1 VOC family protein [Nocardioides sp.]